jgi:tyrosine-protein phosphatase YwqE
MSIFGRLFGRRREPILEPADLSVLNVDVHSHLIPGIDDGSKTMEETLTLLSEFQALGYKKVVTTPHVMSDFYKNTPEIILGGLEKVRVAAKQKGLTIEIDAAAEYNLDADFEPLIDDGNVLTFGDNHVLFELPFIAEPPMLNSIIWKLQTKGYKPVLAHVERYEYWHQDWDKIAGLRDRGVLIQLNINSLTGHYGPEVKRIGEKLVDLDMVDLLGSDCHNMNHMGLTKRAQTKTHLHKVLKSEKLINRKLSLSPTNYK